MYYVATWHTKYWPVQFLENLIRGLDDDEVDFLDIVDKAKMDAEKKQQIEEDNELMEFRQRVATLQEQSIDQVRADGNSLLWMGDVNLTFPLSIHRKSVQKRRNLNQ